MTKYQSSIDGLQRILDEYPGTQHGFDYAFLSEEESKKIIQEARDALVEARIKITTYLEMLDLVYKSDMSLQPPIYKPGNSLDDSL